MTNTNTYDIQLFENTEFGKLTVLTFEDSGDTVWFIGNEVATLLGYTNPQKAVRDHVDIEDRNTRTIRSGNGGKGNPNKVIINESGLYSLILSSKLPSAKRFKRWVTSEVLPTIRKHGAYMTQETALELLNDPEQRDKMLTYFAQGILDRDKIIEEKDKMINGLTTSNNELTLTNAALAEQATTWDNRSIINALVRHWGCVCRSGDLDWAWKSIYKTLNYALGINVYSRKNKKKTSWLDVLTEDEMLKAIKVVAALCEKANINVGKIIGDTNAKMVDELPDLDVA